ncbi:hypothetical protein M3A49_16615 [Paraburkholderia sp. CNPSo 3076]|uniref:hypothetical protein n=1 Tax=Paraburkholderia sp. CNPSo 3076 TaxID=2940936 RepID=UPI0022583CC1|nr:hypothetical protein [Paraburkholderia sp. CNPSo 3076]MCX5541102.1 hypothetical protein [Paraburkholderia sp. CNPSo 3076]
MRRRFRALDLRRTSTPHVGALLDVGSAHAEHRFNRLIDLRFRNIGANYRATATEELPVILRIRWIRSFREDAREQLLQSIEDFLVVVRIDRAL